MSHECDVLIIGCGIAGSVTALELSKSFKNILLLSKNKDPLESNTYYAQGGIIYIGENDDWLSLKKDILYAGDKRSYPPSVDILSKEGPDLVKKILIDDLKVKFALIAKDKFDMTEEAAHSRRRIIHAADHTGNAIQSGLISAVKKNPNIKLMPGYLAVDIITRSHHSNDVLAIYKDDECLGAYVLNVETNEVELIRSKVTIIATGGIGSLYLHTTNPSGATGDGIAMARRAGVKLINMEYTQFHPTSFYHRNSERFLISESVRGEGAVLLNLKHEPFMLKYHKMGDLAPRDFVTRSILTEMMKLDENYVLLDLRSKMKPDFIINRFPTIYNHCLKYNLDITKEPIPVVPSYHYLCGGIKVDIWGRTNTKRLFAVGECACTGVHGANRLASTSLLEGLTWGYRAASHIIENWNNEYNIDDICEVPDWSYGGSCGHIDEALLKQDWSMLQTIMWNYVGPIRSRSLLKRAQKDLNHLFQSVDDFYREYKLNEKLVSLRNAITVAREIGKAAWQNKKSAGCHFRID